MSRTGHTLSSLALAAVTWTLAPTAAAEENPAGTSVSEPLLRLNAEAGLGLAHDPTLMAMLSAELLTGVQLPFAEAAVVLHAASVPLYEDVEFYGAGLGPSISLFGNSRLRLLAVPGYERYFLGGCSTFCPADYSTFALQGRLGLSHVFESAHRSGARGVVSGWLSATHTPEADFTYREEQLGGLRWAATISAGVTLPL